MVAERKFKEQCPETQTRYAGDEFAVFCRLTEHNCILVEGKECEYYEDFLKKIEE